MPSLAVGLLLFFYRIYAIRRGGMFFPDIRFLDFKTYSDRLWSTR
jgi:hypothetical protein